MGCAASAKYKAAPSDKTKSVDPELIDLLSKVTLFQEFQQSQLEVLAQALEIECFEPGEVLIAKGEVTSKFFIVWKGIASVSVGGVDNKPVKKLAELMPGDPVAERALLCDEPRSSTVTCESALEALSITRHRFMELGLLEYVCRPRRQVVRISSQEIQTQTASPKTAEEGELIKEALRANDMLRNTINLDDDHINAMIEICWKRKVEKGATLIAEGAIADYFYVIQEGECEVFQSKTHRRSAWTDTGSTTDTLSSQRSLAFLRKGQCFGEVALLCAAPRSATVLAHSDLVLWVFDRDNFKKILMRASEAAIESYVELISNIPAFSSWSAGQVKRVAGALTEIKFDKDQMIIQQGDVGTAFYILCEGSVRVLVGGMERSILTATPKSPQFFGERALLADDVRTASIRVMSETARALVLDRQSFDLLLQDAFRKTRAASGTSVYELTERESKNTPKFKRLDLQRRGRLGTGAFSVVDLYEHTTTHRFFALKAVNKNQVLMKRMEECALQEKRLMFMLDSPFVVRLVETYNTSGKLLYLMDAAVGGELFEIYSEHGFHGSERHARFYVAGVLLGLQHLHDRKILYRDLKTENILLDERGYSKIADLGLAKYVIGRTYTACGTPEYFAPEMLAHSGYTCAIDWWALGIFTFELMAGYTPFESSSQIKMFEQIVNGIGCVPFPDAFDANSVAHFIKGLLQSDPSDRLPMRLGKSSNLIKHEWYHSFDWESMRAQTLEVPYHPPEFDSLAFKSGKGGKDALSEPSYLPDKSSWDSDFATAVD